MNIRSGVTWVKPVMGCFKGLRYEPGLQAAMICSAMAPFAAMYVRRASNSDLCSSRIAKACTWVVPCGMTGTAPGSFGMMKGGALLVSNA